MSPQVLEIIGNAWLIIGAIVAVGALRATFRDWS